jgi:hypothetical protein
MLLCPNIYIAIGFIRIYFIVNFSRTKNIIIIIIDIKYIFQIEIQSSIKKGTRVDGVILLRVKIEHGQFWINL